MAFTDNPAPLPIPLKISKVTSACSGVIFSPSSNQLRQTGIYLTEDGKAGTLQQIDLRV